MRAAGAIDWIRPPSKALDDSRAPFYGWFPDAVCNTCWNAVDRHVEAGHGDRLAIIYDSPVTGTKARISYAELRDQVARLAGALAARGIGKGDRVDHLHADGPRGLRRDAGLRPARRDPLGRLRRLRRARARGADRRRRGRRRSSPPPAASSRGGWCAYKPLLDAAIDMAAHKPDFVLMLQRRAGGGRAGRRGATSTGTRRRRASRRRPACRSAAWTRSISSTPPAPPASRRAWCGRPPATWWRSPGRCGTSTRSRPARCSGPPPTSDGSVGHSYICYAPLFVGATTVVFEGKPVGTPDAGTFWRVIEEYGVRSFFTAPDRLSRDQARGSGRARSSGDYDLSRPTLPLPRRRAGRSRHHRVGAAATRGVPVIDHWWQTETGWPIAANPAGIELLPVKLGSPTVPMPGYDVRILSDAGEPLPPGELGAVAIRLPLPPGTLPTLWNAEERFAQVVSDHLSRLLRDRRRRA